MQNNLNAAEQKVVAVRQGEKGYSILELITAMVIFLIVTASIFGVLQIAQRSRSVVSQKVQLTKNVRFALNMLGRDTLIVGLGYPPENTVSVADDRITTLIGIPNDVDTIFDVVPPIIPGNDITLNTFNTTAGVKTDQVTFIFQDSTFNPINPGPKEYSEPISFLAPITSPGGIDEITPVSGDSSTFNVNDILVVTGNSGSTLAVVTGESGVNTVHFANGDVLALNSPGVAGPLMLKAVAPGAMRRVRLVTYFVTADGILMREEYGNDPVQTSIEEPLVYGVENFQIQYISEDGSVSDNPVNPSNVRQVRFTVNTRSTELNAAGEPYRVNMTSTFSARNLGYKAD